MSLKFGVLITTASLLVASASVASSAVPLGGNAGEVCAAAAAVAEAQGSAADSQIAACTLAQKSRNVCALSNIPGFFARKYRTDVFSPAKLKSYPGSFNVGRGK